MNGVGGCVFTRLVVVDTEDGGWPVGRSIVCEEIVSERENRGLALV